VSHSTTILANLVRDIADRLEAAAAGPFKALEARPFASLSDDAREASIALTAFGEAVNTALDGLYALVGFHAPVPPIAGGSPAEPHDWTGPTPLDVLAADVDAPAWTPSAADWADYYAERDAHDHAITELDHFIAHGCV